MDVLEDGLCFVCGAENPIGLKASFVVDRDTRSAVCRLQIPKNFQGWKDVVHGGILATLLDETCIYACRSIGNSFVTAELNLKYKKPVPVETEVVLKAKIVEEKRKVLIVKASLEIDGQSYAQADAKVFRMDESAA